MARFSAPGFFGLRSNIRALSRSGIISGPSKALSLVKLRAQEKGLVPILS
jgi:hypothetical protein